MSKEGARCVHPYNPDSESSDGAGDSESGEEEDPDEWSRDPIASGVNSAVRMRVCVGGGSGSCAEWGLLLSGEACLSLGITLVSITFVRIALQFALMDFH